MISADEEPLLAAVGRAVIKTRSAAVTTANPDAVVVSSRCARRAGFLAS